MERVKNFAGDPMPSNWVYGGVFHQNNRGGSFSIIYSYDPIEKFTVYADTVGQYTGICDRNEKQIFEGDIVDILKNEERGVIQWDEDTARFVISMSGVVADFDNYWGKDLEVIGNIYDDPDTTYGDSDLHKRIKAEIRQYSGSIYNAVEKDCTYQAIAVVMAALHREFGFGKDRLNRLKAAIESEYTLMLGGIMGAEYSPRDCQKWLKEQYDIDLEVSRYE